MQQLGSHWTDFHEIWYLSNFQKPLKKAQVYVLSGSHHEVDENCALLGYYVVSSGSFLPTFRDNLTVPSSGVKNPKDSLLSQCWVYVGNIVEVRRFCSVVSANRVDVSGWGGHVVVSVTNERDSMIEDTLTSVTVRDRRALT